MKKSEALTQMEAAIKKYTSEIHLTIDDLYEVEKKQPPRYIYFFLFSYFLNVFLEKESMDRLCKLNVCP